MSTSSSTTSNCADPISRSTLSHSSRLAAANAHNRNAHPMTSPSRNTSSSETHHRILSIFGGASSVSPEALVPIDGRRCTIIMHPQSPLHTTNNRTHKSEQILSETSGTRFGGAPPPQIRAPADSESEPAQRELSEEIDVTCVVPHEKHLWTTGIYTIQLNRYSWKWNGNCTAYYQNLSKGRQLGKSHYASEELEQLLHIVEHVQPISSNMWANVGERYINWAIESGWHLRDGDVLKQNFDKLANTHKKTGDPTFPPLIRKAKLIPRDILGCASLACIGDSQMDDGQNTNSYDNEIMSLGTRCNERKTGAGGISPLTKKRRVEDEL